MSNNPVINPRPATFYCHNQLPFTLHLKGIRSSSFRGTNTMKPQSPSPYIGIQPEGGFAAGQLNTYYDHRQPYYSQPEGGFEFDSIRSRLPLPLAIVIVADPEGAWQSRARRVAYPTRPKVPSSLLEDAERTSQRGAQMPSARRPCTLQGRRSRRGAILGGRSRT